MFMLQAITACVLLTLILLSTSLASSSYGGGIQPQHQSQEGKNFGRFLIKELEDVNPADHWKLIRIEQLLDSLSGSIPPPAVVYQQQQQQQHPSLHQSTALQYSNSQAANGDDNSMLDGSSSRRAMMGLMGSPLSVQTRQVSDALADSNQQGMDSAETSSVPRSQMMQFGLNTGLDEQGAGKSRVINSNSNSKQQQQQQSVATDLGGIVFTKSPGSGSPAATPLQSVSAPYYNARGRGAAMQQQRGTGALTAASLDELRAGSLERPQRRMALTGSEEVPVQPVHSQSNNEWESKRVEASPSRWLNFRGMWGKRNVM